MPGLYVTFNFIYRKTPALYKFKVNIYNYTDLDSILWNLLFLCTVHLKMLSDSYISLLEIEKYLCWKNQFQFLPQWNISGIWNEQN